MNVFRPHLGYHHFLILVREDNMFMRRVREDIEIQHFEQGSWLRAPRDVLGRFVPRFFSLDNSNQTNFLFPERPRNQDCTVLVTLSGINKIFPYSVCPLSP